MQTILIVLNKELDDIMKIYESLEESGLLIQSVRETMKNESKEKKGGFLSKLLGTLGASLSGDILTGKAVKKHTSMRNNNESRNRNNKSRGRRN